jgi:hypothetical protein
VTTEGTPTYCTVDYTGFDYQQFNDRVVMFDPIDSSVGYQPPNAVLNDDGIDFLSTLRVEDVIESGLVVEFGKDDQESGLMDAADKWPELGVQVAEPPDPGEDPKQAYYKTILHQLEMTGTFKLKSMTREFSSDYELQVTDLKIPTGYNLEAE